MRWLKWNGRRVALKRALWITAGHLAPVASNDLPCRRILQAAGAKRFGV
jgi:hypothetical protein